MDGPAQQTDVLLHPFLNASNEVEAEHLLDRILSEYADPIIRAIVYSTLGRSASNPGGQAGDLQDVPDLVTDIKLRLLNLLRRLRSSPDPKSIESFSGYVATTSYNACHSFLRKKYPGRTRLKFKLRYVLSHARNFALWQDGDQQWLCGLSSWKDENRRRTSSGWVNALRLTINDLSVTRSQSRLNVILEEVFSQAPGPLPFEELVTLTCDILGVADITGETSPNPEIEMPDQSQDLAKNLEQRLYLERLWREIARLPVPQRSALLLGLRDGNEATAIGLLLDIRIATARQIADALGIPALEFLRLVQDLPLTDQQIAVRLGTTRQQVASYRLSARRRLARRMRMADRGD